jgi:hypothetical protein
LKSVKLTIICFGYRAGTTPPLAIDRAAVYYCSKLGPAVYNPVVAEIWPRTCFPREALLTTHFGADTGLPHLPRQRTPSAFDRRAAGDKRTSTAVRTDSERA